MHSKENIVSKCKINKISEISKEKLLPFYKKLYPERYKNLTENWKWWYRVDKNFAEPIILSLDDKVIGQAAFLVNNLIVSKKQIPAIWFQDYAVLPEFMGFGLGKLLTKEWMKECENGQKNFLATRAKLAEHPVEKVGANLRAMMPWISKKKLVDSDKS